MIMGTRSLRKLKQEGLKAGVMADPVNATGLKARSGLGHPDSASTL